MSPRIRLLCYPAADAAFASASSASLDIDLPEGAADLVAAVIDRLRGTYPAVRIRVEPDASLDEAIWHVYRDGLPS